MTTTPRVHWNTDASISDFGSPFNEGSSSDSVNSTSSLQYVNSQLVAHGFVQGSGLCLDGLGKDDTDKVVKCLLGMLSQRIVRTIPNICYPSPTQIERDEDRMTCIELRTYRRNLGRYRTNTNVSIHCTNLRQRRLLMQNERYTLINHAWRKYQKYDLLATLSYTQIPAASAIKPRECSQTNNSRIATDTHIASRTSCDTPSRDQED